MVMHAGTLDSDVRSNFPETEAVEAALRIRFSAASMMELEISLIVLSLVYLLINTLFLAN